MAKGRNRQRRKVYAALSADGARRMPRDPPAARGLAQSIPIRQRNDIISLTPHAGGKAVQPTAAITKDTTR